VGGAFGNALGDSIVSTMQPNPALAYDYRNGSDIDSDNASAARERYSLAAGMSSPGGLRARPGGGGLRLSDDAVFNWVADTDAAISRGANRIGFDDGAPTFLDSVRRATGMADVTHDPGDGWGAVLTGGGSNSNSGGGIPISRNARADAAAQLASDPWGLLGPGFTGGYNDVGPTLARANARKEIEDIRARLGSGGRNVPEVGKAWVEDGRVVDDYSPGAVDFHANLTRRFHSNLIHPFFSFEGSRCG
jgi:hypothetical protein